MGRKIINEEDFMRALLQQHYEVDATSSAQQQRWPAAKLYREHSASSTSALLQKADRFFKYNISMFYFFFLKKNIAFFFLVLFIFALL